MGSSFCFWFSQIGDEEDDHRCENGWGRRGKGFLMHLPLGLNGAELSRPAELLTLTCLPHILSTWWKCQDALNTKACGGFDFGLLVRHCSGPHIFIYPHTLHTLQRMNANMHKSRKPGGLWALDRPSTLLCSYVSYTYNTKLQTGNTWCVFTKL